MKILAISLVLTCGTAVLGFTQSEKLQSGDSIRVELERQAVTKELTQLRDSIDQSLHVFDSLIEKARGSKRESLVNGRKELLEYEKLVKLDLVETATTARKAWMEAYVTRIRANTVATRKEYKRIRTKVLKS